MHQKEVPEIFDPIALALSRQRAKHRMAKTGPSFLLLRCAEDVASRIADINRRFTRGLLICNFDIRGIILEHIPQHRRPETMDWQDYYAVNHQNYDLIISLLDLQSENKLQTILSDLRQQLKDDGLFIAAILGGDTLMHLRQTFYQIDQAILGGATARIFPMIDHTQAAGLLSQAGFNLPVIDKDRLTVSYRSLKTLTADLRDLGLNNTLASRNKTRLPKAIHDVIEATYPKSDDGKFSTQFEVLWMTGWAPHESQQKPLKPGSAKTSLAESLRQIRDANTQDDDLKS